MAHGQNDFAQAWKQVEALESKGLTKQALDTVEAIYTKAQSQEKTQQRIKALLYKSKYLQTLEANSQSKIIKLVKNEIKSSEIVTQRILENIYATMLWQYYQQNRHRFLKRSVKESHFNLSPTDDFKQWDLQTLLYQIHTYYQRSLTSAKELQNTPLTHYSLLLSENKASTSIRPTLYDLLSHNALEFYTSKENSIIKPAYKFQLNDAKFLATSQEFIRLPLAAKDSLSLQFQALKIYQKLLKFHEKSNDEEAYVIINIERLNYTYKHSIINNKDAIFINTLRKEGKKIKTRQTSTLYGFELAKHYRNIGSRYDAIIQDKNKQEQLQWRLRDALRVCDSLMHLFPKSKGTELSAILKAKILKPYLSVKTEGFISTQKPFKLLIAYKNLEAIQLDVYRVSQSEFNKYKGLFKSDEQEQFLEALSAVRTTTFNLASEGDYQQHYIEMAQKGLNNGLYILAIRDIVTNKMYSAAGVQVSDIAVIENQAKDFHSYQVISRQNGKPLRGAKVNYRYTLRGQPYKDNLTTDNHGKFIIGKGSQHYRNVEIKVNHNNQEAFFGKYFISRKYEPNNDNKPSYKTYLFTDRSIYRPGQTLYFKGIATQTYDNTTEILPNSPTKIRLHNVNNEVVDEMELTTNAFGSVQGQFILPKSGLNGNYSISMFCKSNSFTPFSVEAYKRPKFQATFNTIDSTYRVNDLVEITGMAKAYVGSYVSNARVNYSVKRIARFPEWYHRYRPIRRIEPQEIAFGSTNTNKTGEFTIAFQAIPDASIDPNEQPIFNYVVQANITDINGETQQVNTTIKVGYHTQQLFITSNAVFDKTEENATIKIESKNLNNQEVAVKGNLKIFKLKAPEAVIRPRAWPAPDYKSMTKANFKSKFPHEAYDQEHKKAYWPKETLVHNEPFNTANDNTVIINAIDTWESGSYMIIAEAEDRFNTKITYEKTIELRSRKDQQLVDHQLFEAYLDKDNYPPNNTAILTLGSAASSIYVTVEIEKNQTITSTEIIELNNSISTIEIPITQDDIGGFTVHCTFAAFNYFHREQIYIDVPYPETELQIETQTFRDLIEPGAKETWTFQIKGAQGDKVSAELLASMYDASLDQFRNHEWNFSPLQQPEYYSRYYKNIQKSFGITHFKLLNSFPTVPNFPAKSYAQLNWFEFYFGNRYQSTVRIRGNSSIARNTMIVADEESVDEVQPSEEEDDLKTTKNEFTHTSLNLPFLRKNLQETAFFFPQLKTDKDGGVSFSFTAPEALTQWKLQLMAHTKTLESQVKQLTAITQKELMVLPNFPRFLRHGDDIWVSTKIANLSDRDLKGSVRLSFYNALTGEPIDALLKNLDSEQSFQIASNDNSAITWHIHIPKEIEAVTYKIIATSQNFSDGQQGLIPVLSNRQLVTETLPMWVNGNETRSFTLDKLKNHDSKTLQHHQLTLEITSHPVWYAIQALPYLMEYPHNCNEQIFSRYYANALGRYIMNSNPRIQSIFKQWQNSDALLSNLEKNQDLKSIIIEETPWLRDALNDTEQKKRLALLFDLNHMSNDLQSSINRLKQNQLANGAWAWFNGGRANRFITQHIVTGFGHLNHLGISPANEYHDMIKLAINYLDQEFLDRYQLVLSENKQQKDKQLNFYQLHYLYMRSFYPEIPMSETVQKAHNYYLEQINTHWLHQSLYAKGLMGLIAHRNNKIKLANAIVLSLKENSIIDDALGMYWKANRNSGHWHSAPIETQALLIEAFTEIRADNTSVDLMKVWLLKHKQTHKWPSTKATTDATYALLLSGSNWTNSSENIEVKVGKTKIRPSELNSAQPEAGTGYYKTTWSAEAIEKNMADITLSKTDKGITWGALYWQYFEDLDKITSAETALQLKKELYIKRFTERGEVLAEIDEQEKLKVGDIMTVRLIITNDRQMEFIHLKDMRASGLEPVDAVSSYKWQDALGYYQTTKDASMHFFFDVLPKGTFVIEYDVKVSHSGEMSNGIGILENMYAPEFSTHSNGIQLHIERP